MFRSDLDPAVRTTVILRYSPSTSCVCCGQNEMGYLNVVPLRPGLDGKQEFVPRDTPTPDRMWQQIFAAATPDNIPQGYAIYCSNCIISHPLGLCPHVG